MARAKTCVCGAGRTVARCGIGGAGVCGEARHLEKRMKQHCGLLHRRHHPSRRPTLQRNIGSRLCIVGRLQGNRAERVLHFAAVLSGRAPWACHWRGQACDACGRTGNSNILSYRRRQYATHPRHFTSRWMETRNPQSFMGMVIAAMAPGPASSVGWPAPTSAAPHHPHRTPREG